MSSKSVRRRSGLKACIKCRALVSMEVNVCPNCKSTNFSKDWSGCTSIMDPERSEVAKLLKITKPGRYALKVR